MKSLANLLLIGLAYRCIQSKAYENRYLGTETPYKFEATAYTPPPQDYYPIYINHLGRHGARYLTSSEELQSIHHLVQEAEKQKALTQKGVRLKESVEKMLAIESGQYGLLTPSGVAMEQGIAKRMYQHFPEVFGKPVRAVSTYVERTKQSMAAFLDELGLYTDSNLFEATSNGKVDPILRFFDLNQAYLMYKASGSWREAVREYEERANLSEPFLSQFFTRNYVEQLVDPITIATEIYNFYTNQYDIADCVGLGQYFNQEQLQYYWENKNLSAYLEKGPSAIGEDLPTNIAFALLADFLTTTQEVVDGKSISANLRFAHAETIIPFASLLKLPCCSQQTDNWKTVKEIWKDNEVAPMAANIQWILYTHPEKKDYLIKMLYNEKEIAFPIPSDEAPYYQWEAVKHFYYNILEGLNLDLEGSLVEIVKNYTVRNDETI